jgi:hypothetical protein
VWRSVKLCALSRLRAQFQIRETQSALPPYAGGIAASDQRDFFTTIQMSAMAQQDGYAERGMLGAGKRRDRQHLVRSQHTQGQGGPVPSGMAPPPNRIVGRSPGPSRLCDGAGHGHLSTHHLHGPSQRIAGRICTLRGPQHSTGQVWRKWVLLPWLPRICDGTERTTRGVLGVECRGHPSLLCCDMQVRKRKHPTPVSSWDCAT